MREKNQINRNKAILVILTVLLILILFMWQFCMFVTFNISESSHEVDSIKIMSSPRYFWKKESNVCPKIMVRYGEEMIFRIPQQGINKDVKIRITHVKLESLFNGETFSYKTDQIFNYIADSNEFISSIELFTFIQSDTWRSFIIILDVLFDNDDTKKTFLFEHQVSQSKYYGLHFKN